MAISIVAWGFATVCVVAATAVTIKFLGTRTKIKAVEAKAIEQVQKGKYGQMAEYVDKIPFVLEETINTYNAMQANCAAQNMSKENSDKILEPMLKNIHRLEKLNNIKNMPFGEPMLKVGASFADKGVEIIDKFLGNVGK
jgi:hypothetical protein